MITVRGQSQSRCNALVTLYSHPLRHHGDMKPVGSSPFFAHAAVQRVLSCWNWKCALLSATARSVVYMAAMARSGLRGSLAIVLVEMAYVTLTAGIYAGLQQKALGLRSRLMGNFAIVIAVPGLSLALDWLAHRAAGATAPAKATFAVCFFATISALFHLHVMRRGAFLTGHRGHSLVEDFRRIPRLTLGFVLLPFALLSSLGARTARALESEAAL